MRFAACWCSVCGRCRPGGAFAWPYRLSNPSLICQRALPSTTYWRGWRESQAIWCFGSSVLSLSLVACLPLSSQRLDGLHHSGLCSVPFSNSKCVRQALLKPQDANTPVCLSQSSSSTTTSSLRSTIETFGHGERRHSSAIHSDQCYHSDPSSCCLCIVTDCEVCPR